MARFLAKDASLDAHAQEWASIEGDYTEVEKSELIAFTNRKREVEDEFAKYRAIYDGKSGTDCRAYAPVIFKRVMELEAYRKAAQLRDLHAAYEEGKKARFAALKLAQREFFNKWRRGSENEVCRLGLKVPSIGFLLHYLVLHLTSNHQGAWSKCTLRRP